MSTMPIRKITIIALVGSVVESLPFRDVDNITVTLVALAHPDLVRSLTLVPNNTAQDIPGGFLVVIEQIDAAFVECGPGISLANRKGPEPGGPGLLELACQRFLFSADVVEIGSAKARPLT